ncbi:Glycosyltransferase involved in cell wall bisynthesis [Parapedobacter composti]|uniref:Glycosyltransferase involved in cell wall bisynthesis n=1 Tax=Parapedobacter composti TaxID=623281 RepID=A0A1I1I5R9_9SPHI|nr:glycosyltransferase family 4 protein [Parapedobacter composti]SFC31789.1 Glycosyltransferase involved in cell wall bisynthesis [Parapedobacter composti]
MNKRIALVSNTSWSFVKFRLPLLIRLKAAGYGVIVVAPPDEESAVFAEHGLTYVPLLKLQQKGKNPWHDYRLYREIRQIYATWRPDLAIHYTIKPNIYATKAASSLGIPCIAVITGLGYAYINGGLLAKITDFLYKHALKHAEQVWFLNRDDRAVFVQTRKIVQASRAVLLNGEGIDAKKRFNPEGVERKRESGALRFLFVGRLLHDKGIGEYVEAAAQVKARHPEMEFNILGYLNVDNPSAVRAETLAAWEERGVVKYLGAVADVRSVLLQHDCVVLPSYREGMSTTLMEAAALGLPLIATDIPGCKELVDEGVTGFLCRPKDVSSLANRMADFIRLSPSARLAMGQQGREKMLREFDMDAVIAYYFTVIRNLLNESAK